MEVDQLQDFTLVLWMRDVCRTFLPVVRAQIESYEHVRRR